MNFVKKVWNWLVWSSQDPNKVALTVKGALLGVSGFVMVATGLFGLHNVTTASFQDSADLVSQFVGQGLVLVGTVTTMIGLARKIYSTVKVWFS